MLNLSFYLQEAHVAAYAGERAKSKLGKVIPSTSTEHAATVPGIRYNLPGPPRYGSIFVN